MTPAPTSIELFTARPERGAKNKICTTYNLCPSALLLFLIPILKCFLENNMWVEVWICVCGCTFSQIYASGSDYIFRAADASTYQHMYTCVHVMLMFV